MQIILLSLFLLSGALAETSLILRPAIVTRCSPGHLGRAKVAWTTTAPGPVSIRLGSATGRAMTGNELPVGEAETGDWVSNGQVFVLADANGNELGRATAQVICSALPDPVAAAQAADSYFPLQVGNVWMYRADSRALTSDYVVRRVLKSEVIGGKVWYLVADSLPSQQTETAEGGIWYRVDEQGRVFRRDAQGHEVLWLDPTPAPDPAAVLPVRPGGPFHSALGAFAESLSYALLGSETGTFVRGVGLVSFALSSLSGSSGGFENGLELVSARLGDNIRYGTSGAALQLGAESVDLDVSHGHVTNCAIPCYFVACYIAGADPPRTYKPCFQARLRIEDSRALVTSRTIEMDFLDGTGSSLFHAEQKVTTGDEQPESVVFQQIPLYFTPHSRFAPGQYKLRAQVTSDDGASQSAEISVRVR